MSEIKERIIGALSIMSDDDAKILWAYIQDGYVTKVKSWDDIEETEPTDEELEVISKYKNGDPDFVPALTHEEVLKELGL